MRFECSLKGHVWETQFPKSHMHSLYRWGLWELVRINWDLVHGVPCGANKGFLWRESLRLACSLCLLPGGSWPGYNVAIQLLLAALRLGFRLPSLQNTGLMREWSALRCSSRATENLERQRRKQEEMNALVVPQRGGIVRVQDSAQVGETHWSIWGGSVGKHLQAETWRRERARSTADLQGVSLTQHPECWLVCASGKGSLRAW